MREGSWYVAVRRARDREGLQARKITCLFGQKNRRRGGAREGPRAGFAARAGAVQPWYSNRVNPKDLPTSPRSSAPALAAETITEMNWSRFLWVSAGGILIPTVILAPVLHWALAFPGLTLWGAFRGLLNILFFLVPMAVVVHGGRPGVEYLKHTICRVEVFEHGVEIRDGQGNVLGETADGSARVSRANMATNRGMYACVLVEYRGGRLLMTPSPFVGAHPGLPATPGIWRPVPEATYQLLLRFAV